ncbi:hypothetical protein RR46_05923 [Papilio xuthus]|uniref:Uncharacterized protein n=1 Tax=Papilio xuthus TaxID=66420 RepID=A0A194PMK9_PAPXU|nr:hypothetical protein RR46_05923 [Papilio xuthus]
MRSIVYWKTGKVVLWSIGVVGTSAVVVGVLSRYLARRRAKPILNPRIQRALNKRISRMRSPNGGMGSGASSCGRSSPLGFSERLSMASGSVGSGGGDAAPLSPQQLGVMGKYCKYYSMYCSRYIQFNSLKKNNIECFKKFETELTQRHLWFNSLFLKILYHSYFNFNVR